MFSLHGQVGKLQCPLLLVSGEDDCNIPAVESAEDIRKMMEAAGNVHLLTSMSYPGTGHLIDPPYCPHIPFSKMVIPTKNKKGNTPPPPMPFSAHSITPPIPHSPSPICSLTPPSSANNQL
nr:PREDICTED: bile acid-CoA:amino acid N-acyltransferase-like [Latimeria chalumnae]|eukprot:XP_014351396.1 PREDICTED: bile acid-CoA:amino acid N-acyltransferase-like [Latimeria chalumnae]